MKHTEKECSRINYVAGMYLSEQDDGTLIDAYDRLKEAYDNGKQFENASDYCVLWEPLEDCNVTYILDLIESGINQLEELITLHGGSL